MNRATSVGSAPAAAAATAATAVPARVAAGARLVFLDNLRYLLVLLVVVYHALSGYSRVGSYWAAPDTHVVAADIVRELIDVFTMPVLFFIAGYFALNSLQRKGAWAFVKDKVLRLLIPWALALLVFSPLLFYDRPGQAIRPFWNYWLWYMTSFGSGLNLLRQTATNQLSYWFISLLFAFCVLLALGYALAARLSARADEDRRTRTQPAAGKRALLGLGLFGLLTAGLYCASLLFVPDGSWFTLSVFLEFQVTRLGLFAAYFALGVYARSQGWFRDNRPVGTPVAWGAASAVLAIIFLAAFQPLLTDPTATAPLPATLAFALVRSFLLLALFVTLIAAGSRYWNYASGIDRSLAETSYNIYLTHIIFVFGIQSELVAWTAGPVAVKFAIVLLVSLALSYAVSRWLIGRFPRAFTLGLLGLFVFCLVVRP